MSKIKEHLDSLEKLKPLEDYCTQCGICCNACVVVEGSSSFVNIKLVGLPCKFLKWKNGKSCCSVYENRFEKAPWCASTVKMLHDGLLPKDCPYVSTAGSWYTPAIVLGYKDLEKFKPTAKRVLEGLKVNPVGAEAYRRFFDD